jgi:ubiquitin C-terminal hydrolase
MNQNSNSDSATNDKVNSTVYIENNDSFGLMEPKKKREKILGLTGIVNTGNTCYMNSAVQAFSHNYPLTNYLFTNKKNILEILKKNAHKILKDNNSFKLDQKNSIVPMELRMKIQDEKYNPESLTEEELKIVYNNTITSQLMRLLENMWANNCGIIPTSFRKIFSEARDKFFYGCEQHDAEEAYSCILQKMQEELAENKDIKFKITDPAIQEFLQFKNDISAKIQNAASVEEKKFYFDLFKQKKKSMPAESLTIEAYREMKKYYSSAYSRITEIFTGFLHSSIACPNSDCGFSSNKFDPFLHLSLQMPVNGNNNPILDINDCISEYCREEILDPENLWHCEGCNNNVRAIKKLLLWTAPPVLVIQLKRFGMERSRKDSRLVKYPMNHFDISSMISSYGYDENKCYKYRLQCVINHTGNLNGGHYYTYCLDEDSGQWYKYDDLNVSKISDNFIVTNNAYLLFYMREDMIKEI